MSVALHHLSQWVDKGTVPPRADRILVDRNAANDGSLMALDEHGNPKGGIRNPYVDVPVGEIRRSQRRRGAADAEHRALGVAADGGKASTTCAVSRDIRSRWPHRS